MTEQEKRALALQIMEQEAARFQNRTHALNDQNQQRLNASLQRTAKQRQVFTNLARNGITWEELKAVYNKAFDEGQTAMLTFRMSFFYGCVALAYQERFQTKPEATASFITKLSELMKKEGTKDKIILDCKAETGVDTSTYDIIAPRLPSTRKDQEAVERMKQRGITQKDLDYERELGYQNGWHADFYLSACFAGVSLALARFHRFSAEEIEAFFDRMKELEDEEISAADIIERVKKETGVDVSGIAAMEAKEL